MSIIAIDPGKNGGAVDLDDFGGINAVLAGGDSPRAMLYFLRECKQRNRDRLKAVIEQQHSFPGMAAKTNFVVAYGYGFWHGLLTAEGIGFETVSAAKWQTIITKQKGWSRAQLKQALIEEALRRWPALGEYKKGELSGICDAALLAEFVRTRGR